MVNDGYGELLNNVSTSYEEVVDAIEKVLQNSAFLVNISST